MLGMHRANVPKTGAGTTPNAVPMACAAAALRRSSLGDVRTQSPYVLSDAGLGCGGVGNGYLPRAKSLPVKFPHRFRHRMNCCPSWEWEPGFKIRTGDALPA